MKPDVDAALDDARQIAFRLADEGGDGGLDMHERFSLYDAACIHLATLTAELERAAAIEEMWRDLWIASNIAKTNCLFKPDAFPAWSWDGDECPMWDSTKRGCGCSYIGERECYERASHRIIRAALSDPKEER